MRVSREGFLKSLLFDTDQIMGVLEGVSVKLRSKLDRFLRICAVRAADGSALSRKEGEEP